MAAPVGAITELLNKALDVWQYFMKTKRVRYSIEGNKIAYEYIKRVNELYSPEDKKLKAYESKFVKLAIDQ